MGRNSYVLLYGSYLETLEPFTEEEQGRLLIAMLKYGCLGKNTEFTGNERFLWPTLRQQIDRDQLKYDEVCEKNRLNGLRGGRPRKDPEVPQPEKTDRFSKTSPRAKTEQKASAKNPKSEGFSEKPKKANEKENEKEKEKENENGSENEMENEPGQGPDSFPPTAAAVEKFCIDEGISIDAGHFVDYYTAVGWKMGSVPIEDWRAAVRSWKRRERNHGEITVSPYGSIGCEL